MGKSYTHVECMRAAQHGRTTKGTIYKLTATGRIKDDKGKAMQPYDDPAYWKKLTKDDLPPQIETQLKTEEKFMLEIKSAVLIDGKPASDMTEGHLMNLLLQEQRKFDDLKKIQKIRASKNIAGKIDAIGENITTLVVLLDKRDAEAEKAALSKANA